MAETQDQDHGSPSYRNVTWTANQDGCLCLQKNLSEQEVLSYSTTNILSLLFLQENLAYSD